MERTSCSNYIAFIFFEWLC